MEKCQGSKESARKIKVQEVIMKKMSRLKEIIEKKCQDSKKSMRRNIMGKCQGS